MPRDDAWLFDILNAAQSAVAFTRDLSYDEFRASELHQHAVIRCLTIAGEAAKNVSPGLKEAHPEVPWKDIAGLRDVVVHQYFRIQLRRVWSVVHTDLPALIAAVALLVAPPEETDR